MAWNPSDKKRETMPISCFLKPGERKYPYKVKKNGKWVVSATQLRAAISCANRAGDKAIADKASKMLAKFNNK
jgi:hypothetical protein